MNVQKGEFEKISGVHASSCKPTKKVCDENERKKQRRKNDCCIKIFVVKGRTDFNELRVIDSSNNEGTNSLVSG